MMDEITSKQQSESSFLEEQMIPPHGFKGPLEEVPLLTPGLLVNIAIIGLVLLMALSLIFKFIKFLRQRSQVKETAQNDDERVLAWGRLKSEIETIRINPGAEREFANRLSLCLRRGVEIQTNLPLPERTNQEIQKILMHTTIQGLLKDEVLAMLTRLDEVRFAGYPLEHPEALELLDRLKYIVSKLETAGVVISSQPNFDATSPQNVKERIFD